MNNNSNTVNTNKSGSNTQGLETPRESPQSRSSPKHRGIRVTFDSSSLNSSPKSRSSREKDEEEFRTNVAQSLGLSSGSIVTQNHPCGNQPESSMDKGKEGKMTSKGRNEITGLSESEIAPIDHEVPSEDIGQQVDGKGDGMAEYAAHYKEHPQDMSDNTLENTTPSQEDLSVPCPKGSNISSRRELREPDGASGTSSPSVNPPKDAAGGKGLPFQREGPNMEKEHKDQSPKTKKQSGAGVEELMTTEEMQENKLSVPNDDVSDIPSTNIAVACLVTLCFNLPFGVLAIYFSLMATKAYRDGNTKLGAKKARISIYISLFSIVLTVLIVMTVVLLKAIEGQARQRRYNTKTSVNL